MANAQRPATPPAPATAAPLEPPATDQAGLRTRGGRLRPSVHLSAAALTFATAWLLSVVWTAPDEAIAGWVNGRLDEAARADWRAASWPGATTTGLALGLAGAVACAWMREWRAAGTSLLATFVSSAAVQGTKLLIGRDRPDGAVLDTHAFPSGHAATAMLAWGLLALVVLPAVARHWRFTPLARRFAIGVWLGVAATTGACRVLGGVHWASDVVAGWAFGGVVLAVAVRLARTDRPPPRVPAPAG